MLDASKQSFHRDNLGLEQVLKSAIENEQDRLGERERDDNQDR